MMAAGEAEFAIALQRRFRLGGRAPLVRLAGLLRHPKFSRHATSSHFGRRPPHPAQNAVLLALFPRKSLNFCWPLPRLRAEGRKPFAYDQAPD
jgi:hypothetical protein